MDVKTIKFENITYYYILPEDLPQIGNITPIEFSKRIQSSLNYKLIGYNITSEIEWKFSKTKLLLECNICNFIWNSTTINDEKYLKSGCKRCYNSKRGMSQKMNTFSFIQKAKEMHKLKYSYENVLYINNNEKVSIHCNSCGADFKITPNSHLSGKSGCGSCSNKRKGSTQKLTLNEILIKFINKFNTKYDYTLVNYINYDTKVKIKCNTCDTIFEKTPNKHLSGQGCTNCVIYGYNKHKPGFLYIHKIDDNNYKLGITNNYHSRYYNQCFHNKINLIKYKLFTGDGFIIQKIEHDLMNNKNIVFGSLNKDQFNDGYTETFNKIYLEQILSLINSEKEIINV